MSMTAISGKNGLTHDQYDTMYSTLDASLAIAGIVCCAILDAVFDFFRFGARAPAALREYVKRAIMEGKPIYHRSYVMELLETKLDPFKLKANLLVFQEQIKHRKKRKQRKSSRTRGKSNPKVVLVEDEEEPSAFTGKHTTTQTIGIGDLAQRELAFPDTEAAFLAHVVFDENGVPHDIPEVICDDQDEGLLPPTFASVPIWAKRHLIFGREAPFGASADFAEKSARDRTEEDGEVVGEWRAKMFIQDSKLNLNVNDGICIALERIPGGAVERVCFPGGKVDFFVRGEPFIASRLSVTNAILKESEFSKLYEAGDCLWEIEFCQEQTDYPVTSLKRKRKSLACEAHCDETNSLRNGFREHKAYLRFSCRTQGMDKEDTRSAYSLVCFDGNRQRRADRCYNSNILGVICVPPYWRQGDVRPVVPGGDAPDFMKHGMGPDGLPWIHIPMLLYSDDVTIANWLQSKAGGLYLGWLSFPPEMRTGSEAVRCMSVACNAVNSDAVMTSYIDELSGLSSEGRVVYSATHGVLRIFIHVVGHVCDYVQTAQSTDQKGHNSSSYCSICAVRKESADTACYATPLSSANLCLSRSDARQAALRERFIDNGDSAAQVKKQLIFLGLSLSTLQTPLQILTDKVNRSGPGPWRREYLQEYTPMKLYSESSKHSWQWDTQRSNIPGVDHLITVGNDANATNFAYSTLKTHHDRRQLNDMTIEALRISGLPFPKAVIKSSGSVSEGFINSFGVSKLAPCCVFTALALTSVERDGVKVPAEAYEVLEAMSVIRDIIHFNPRPKTSTRSEARLRKERAMRLPDIVALYLDIVVRLCGMAKFEDAAVSMLNRPNLHRMFEFAVFFFPALGFSLHTGELVFEKYHQLVKQYALRTKHPDHMGFEIMQKIRQDEVIKRLHSSEGMDDCGPARLFSWAVPILFKPIWKVIKTLVSGSHRTTTEAPTENNFRSILHDRIWVAKGLTKNSEKGEVRVSNSETYRAKNLVTCALRDVCVTGSDNGIGEVEIKSVQAVQFGIGARAHHLLRRGYFVSGTCDSDVTPAALSLLRGGTEQYIATRLEARKESDNKSSFAMHRFTLLIAELWQCRQKYDDGKSDECIFVRGRPLFDRGYNTEKSGVLVFDAKKTHVWVRLDCSCRRVAGFPWLDSTPDNPNAGALIEDVGNEVNDYDSFAVLHEKDSYPPRAG